MAATGKVLGTVASVVGEAKATAADGTVRILQVGDVVHSDEVITTSAAGAINIALESGKTLDCGANTDLSLHESILGVATAASPAALGVPGTAAAPGSVEALQQAIASGQDPSQIAPATAAGGAPAAGGAGGDGGGGTPVVLEQANTAGVISSGFPTAGASITFPTPEFELLPTEEEEQPPAVSVSVQVQVQVQVEVEVSIEGQPNVVSGPAQGGVFAVSASGDAVSLIEGTMEGTMTIPFVITLDRVFDTDVQVTYQIVPDSASTPSDFFDGALTATITIPAGETSFTVPIQIVRDHFVEGNESFHIVLIDAVNATINPDADSASVTIFNDDAPPVANNDTNWAQEDVQITAAGNVLQDQPHSGAPSGSFADAADTDFEPLAVTNPGTYAGTYGTLVLNSNGSYTYTLNNSNAAVQALDTGETLTDSFGYSATDGFNTPDSATLTVTIFGTNDAPTVVADTNWSKEDTNTTASGNVLQDVNHPGAPLGSFADHADSDTDVETLTTTLVSSGTGSFGSLVLNSDGSYTYTLANGNAAVQGLDDGETLTDTFTYAASDGTTSTNATLTITIFGSNDAPTVAADTNWSKEDTNTTASGNVLQNIAHNGAPDEQSRGDVADSDVDVEPLTASLVSSGTGSFGSLVLNSDGSYIYTLNNDSAAVQGLDDGETLTDTFTYAANDGTTSSNATLTITIFGSNDAPTVAADTNWSKEDTNTTASGNVLQDINHAGAPSGSFADVADSDVDVEPLSASLVSSPTGSFGSLVLNSDGSYTYTLNNGLPAVQGLDDGETLTDSFTYAASDGTSSTNSTLTITIFGTNDAPTIAAQTAATVSEEGLPSGNPDTVGSNDTTNATVAGGTITVADVDIEDLTVTLSAPTETLTSKGTTIEWEVTNGGHTLTGTAGSATIVTITITDAGVYAVTLSGQIDHENTSVEDEASFNVGLTVSDGTASAQGNLTVTVEDDSPVISAVTDLIYSNSSNPTPGGTGVFDYNIGADARTSYDAAHSDFATITLAGTVGTAAIVDPTLTWSFEDASSAIFDISFSYQADPSSSTLTAATGTLSFDKVNGTYTVQLDAPISSFTVLTTSNALGFQGYVEGSSTQDNSGPAPVTVAQLSSNFFVQFTGDQETGGQSPVNLSAGTTNPGDNAYTNGELFFAPNNQVTVSSVAAGVADNTMQNGEVLDFDFFTFNPTGFSSTTPDARANGIFLKFDGIGNNEDLVIVLKLTDPDDNSTITKAIVVDNADMYKFGDALPAGYGITLGQNDGAVIIESNDYNGAGENYVISGAQVLVSTEGITGTGIDLNSNGASTGTETFSTTADSGNNHGGTWDGDVIKIIDIGFVTETTSTANANLNFLGVSVVDADGDATAVQNLDVTVVGSTTYAGTADDEVFQGSAANETMTGGGGNDIFDFNSMTDAADVVTDFHIGNTLSDANADVLDISEILPAATEGATSAGTLSGYVTLQEVGGNTVVQVDADGGGNTFQTLVTLNGVTGVTLQMLLDNHQLVT
jgi:T1SS-143 domain-containing protein